MLYIHSKLGSLASYTIWYNLFVQWTAVAFLGRVSPSAPLPGAVLLVAASPREPNASGCLGVLKLPRQKKSPHVGWSNSSELMLLLIIFNSLDVQYFLCAMPDPPKEKGKQKLGIYIIWYVNSFFGCSSQGGAFIYDSASRPLLKVRWALGGSGSRHSQAEEPQKFLRSKSWTRLRRCHCLLCWCWMPSQKLLKLHDSQLRGQEWHRCCPQKEEPITPYPGIHTADPQIQRRVVCDVGNRSNFRV